MYAKYEGVPSIPSLDVRGNGLVGKEHQFFDEAVGFEPLPSNNVDWMAFIIHDDPYFRQVEVDGPLAEAISHQRAGKTSEFNDV